MTHTLPQPDGQARTLSSSLARFQRGYHALFALIEDYPEPLREMPGACGFWSPKQVLAHLSGWLVEANRRFGDYERGDQREVQYNLNDNYAAFNAQSVNDRATLHWHETVADLRQTYADFTRRATSIPPAHATDDPRYEEWLITLWDDCIEHVAQLCDFVDRNKSAPLIDY